MIRVTPASSDPRLADRTTPGWALAGGEDCESADQLRPRAPSRRPRSLSSPPRGERLRASRFPAITIPIASTQLGTSVTLARPLSARISSSSLWRASARGAGSRPASSIPRKSRPSSSSSYPPATGVKSSRRPRDRRDVERSSGSGRRLRPVVPRREERPRVFASPTPSAPVSPVVEPVVELVVELPVRGVELFRSPCPRRRRPRVSPSLPRVPLGAGRGGTGARP